MTCRICGCTETDACPAGCCWVEPNLCSVCYEMFSCLVEYMQACRYVDAASMEKLHNEAAACVAGEPEPLIEGRLLEAEEA